MSAQAEQLFALFVEYVPGDGRNRSNFLLSSQSRATSEGC
jgi:hypothetical protein